MTGRSASVPVGPKAAEVRQAVVQAVGDFLGPAWPIGLDEALRTAYENALMRVVVVGKFKAGKSSLINNLIGMDLQETGDLPVSAAVSEIMSGDVTEFGRLDDPQVAWGRSAPTAPLSLEEYRAAQRQTSPELVVLRATAPMSWLPAHVVVADTPGVASGVEAHTQVTYGYLANANAIVFVANGAGGTLREDELEFLTTQVIPARRDRIVFVLTRRDEMTSEQRKQVLDQFRKVLVEEAGVPIPRILMVDNASAASARATGGTLAGTGIDELRSLLQVQFFDHVDKVRQDALVSCALQQARQAALLLRNNAENLVADPEKFAGRVAELEQAKGNVSATQEKLRSAARREADALKSAVDDQVRAVLDQVCGNSALYFAQLKGSAANPGAVHAQMRSDISSALAQWQETWLRPKLETAISNLSGDVREAAVELAVPKEFALDDLKASGGGAVDTAIDIAVEVGLFVVLDLVLPGGAIWAFAARLLGKSAIRKVSEPVKDALKTMAHGLVATAASELSRQAIEMRIRQLHGELSANVQRQVGEVLRAAADAAVGSLSAKADELRAQIRAVEEERRSDARAIEERRNKMLGAAAQLETIR
jgi:hypothetical protein